MNKTILKLAIPAIATNITVPLLSLVDMMIVGHLDNIAYIGAIAVGGTLFNLIYWNFGFLRMGTSGLTAQAYGARDLSEATNLLMRSLLVALTAGLLIWSIKGALTEIAFSIMDTSYEIKEHALTYFNICILGAPAVLGLYSIKGWFIGMQNSLFPMITAISINVINIVCSLVLVFVFNMEIIGVALGTVLSQYFGLLIAAALWLFRYKKLKRYIEIQRCLDLNKLKRFFSINGGIFIRTLCLVAVTSFFTFAGAEQGDMLLAVNTLLMQLFTLFSYFMDGFAYAGEALTGRYVGAKNNQMIGRTVKYIFYWGISLSVTFTILYAFFAEQFLGLLTNKETIIITAQNYSCWILAVPLAGFSAFLWDGIMVGATMIKGMLCAMLAATSLFFIFYFSLHSTIGNNALWLAFIVYLSARGLVQTIYFKKRIHKAMK